MLYNDDSTKVDAYIQMLEQALGLLQDADSLGASGSRGSGTVRLDDKRLSRKKVSDIRAQFAAS